MNVTTTASCQSFLENAQGIKDEILTTLKGIDPSKIIHSPEDKSHIRQTVKHAFTLKNKILEDIDQQIVGIRPQTNNKASLKALQDMRIEIDSIWKHESEIHSISRNLKSFSHDLRDYILNNESLYEEDGLDKEVLSKINQCQQSLKKIQDKLNKNEIGSSDQLKTNEYLYIQQKMKYLQSQYADISKMAQFYSKGEELKNKATDLSYFLRPLVIRGKLSAKKEARFHATFKKHISNKEKLRKQLIVELHDLAKRSKKITIDDLGPHSQEALDIQCLALSIATVWNHIKSPSDPIIPTLVYRDSAFLEFNNNAKEAFSYCKTIARALKQTASLIGKSIDQKPLPDHLIDHDVENEDEIITTYKSPEAICVSIAADAIGLASSGISLYFDATSTYANMQKLKNYQKQINTLKKENTDDKALASNTIANRSLYIKLKRRCSKIKLSIGIGITTIALGILDIGSSVISLIRAGIDLATIQAFSELSNASELVNPTSELLGEIAGPLGIVVGCVGIGLGAYFTVKGILDIAKNEKSISRSKRQIVKHQERRSGILRSLKLIENDPSKHEEKIKLERELHFSDLELRRSRHKEFALRKQRALKILNTAKTAFFTIAGAVMLTLGLTVSGIGIPLAIASLTIAILSLITFFALRSYEKSVNKGLSLDIKNRATKIELDHLLSQVNSLDRKEKKEELRKIFEMLDQHKIQTILKRIHKSYQNDLEKDKRVDFPIDDSKKIFKLFHKYSEDALEMYYWGIIK